MLSDEAALLSALPMIPFLRGKKRNGEMGILQIMSECGGKVWMKNKKFNLIKAEIFLNLSYFF